MSSGKTREWGQNWVKILNYVACEEGLTGSAKKRRKKEWERNREKTSWKPRERRLPGVGVCTAGKA